MKYIVGFLILIFALPLFSQITDQKDSVFGDYIDSAVMRNPNREYRAHKFADWLDGETDKRKATFYYNLLQREYEDDTWVQEALFRYDLLANSPVQVGKQIPSFEIDLLGGMGKVSNSSMLGKYYLLHFWATWMGCSVADIPDLNRAYKKYAGKKGFQIISVSFDSTAKCTAPFYEKGWKLEDKWRMPWLHSFAPGVFNSNGHFKSDFGVYASEIGKKFVLLGIPRLLLVGPDGKILAMNSDLRGEQLEKTLGEYLGEGN